VLVSPKERGCVFEVNTHPTGLDIDDMHCRTAKARSFDGRMFTVGLGAIGFSVDPARRG